MGRLAVNKVTNKIYVAGQPYLIVVDGATLSIQVMSVYVYQHIAVNDKTNKIYLTNAGGYGLVVVDGATNVATGIQVDGIMGPLVIDSYANKIYATNFGTYPDGALTILDGNARDHNDRHPGRLREFSFSGG